MDEIKSENIEMQAQRELEKTRAERAFYSAEELSVRNNVHIRKVYRVLRKGGVKKVKLGGAKFYYEPDFLTCLEMYSKKRDTGS